jgi:hypothetical protein
MAQFNGQSATRSAVQAARRLDEIDREVEQILRAFPDLRAPARGRPPRAIFWTDRFAALSMPARTPSR